MSSHPAAANRILEADALTHTGHGRLRRISEALGWDHERLARLEVAAFVARAAGEAETAEKWYAAFSSALRRHIAVEEEFLFPVFEKRLGLSPSVGPTDVLRREHGEILQLVGEILRTIGDRAKLPDEARAAFHEVLEKHHLKEEEILYPALDYALSPSESDALVAKIQDSGS
jgi:iron-sulfur cluster repair protein YtfE (RIC family)